jgi:hypothetical protein
MSQLSRRSLVARVAALPLSAPAALASIPTADASETVIERLAAELAVARDRHSTACEHLNAVDEARFDWQEVWEKLNPRPAEPPRSLVPAVVPAPVSDDKIADADGLPILRQVRRRPARG